MGHGNTSRGKSTIAHAITVSYDPRQPICVSNTNLGANWSYLCACFLQKKIIIYLQGGPENGAGRMPTAQIQPICAPQACSPCKSTCPYVATHTSLDRASFNGPWKACHDVMLRVADAGLRNQFILVTSLPAPHPHRGMLVAVPNRVLVCATAHPSPPHTCQTTPPPLAPTHSSRLTEPTSPSSLQKTWVSSTGRGMRSLPVLMDLLTCVCGTGPSRSGQRL